MHALWAERGAVTATRAFVGKEPDRGGKINALGDVTPYARKRTALEKNGGADAVAVVYGKPLDLNNSRHNVYLCLQNEIMPARHGE
jgi:hypothetical protein